MNVLRDAEAFMNLELNLSYYSQHLRKAHYRDVVANISVRLHLLGSETTK